jgi:hypothetical protein
VRYQLVGDFLFDAGREVGVTSAAASKPPQANATSQRFAFGFVFK